jgi:mannan endo-1,4-beta-mannosidase
MIAATRIPLPKGKWILRASSDDGIRVRVDGEVVIENWTWHGPERNEATFESPGDRNLLIEVEHFEIDGHAELDVQIEAQQPQKPGVPGGVLGSE